jgi:hypothetical protein
MRSAGEVHETNNSLLIGDILPKLHRNMIYNWNKLSKKGEIEQTLSSLKKFLIFEEKVWEADPTNVKQRRNK